MNIRTPILLPDMPPVSLAGSYSRPARISKKRCVDITFAKCGASDLLATSSLVDKDYQMMERIGISRRAISQLFRSMEVTITNIRYHGVGIFNQSRGIEVYCPEYKAKPVSIGKHGVTFIPNDPGVIARSCVVFENFLDYLAYCTYILRIGKKDVFDAIIANHPDQFLEVMISTDPYERVMTCFSDGIYGNTMFKTLKERNPRVDNMTAKIFSSQAVLDILRRNDN